MGYSLDYPPSKAHQQKKTVELPAIEQYHCRLCNVHNLKPEQWQQHVLDFGHRERSSQVAERFQLQGKLSKRQRAVQSFQPRIAALGHSAWRNELQAEFMSYLDNSETHFRVPGQEILKKVERYERLERISLLEQAAWRMVCKGFPKNPRNDHLFWAEWIDKGWKGHKTENAGRERNFYNHCDIRSAIYRAQLLSVSLGENCNHAAYYIIRKENQF